MRGKVTWSRYKKGKKMKMFAKLKNSGTTHTKNSVGGNRGEKLMFTMG